MCLFSCEHWGGIELKKTDRVYINGNKLKNYFFKERRLTGQHETASIDRFSYGVAARNASIRIPRQTQVDGFVSVPFLMHWTE